MATTAYLYWNMPQVPVSRSLLPGGVVRALNCSPNVFYLLPAVVYLKSGTSSEAACDLKEIKIFWIFMILYFFVK